MHDFGPTRARALRALEIQLGNPQAAYNALSALDAAGLQIADPQRDELVCRWVDVQECAVPPEADTIIRTITKTNAAGQTSTTHWLDGLRGPTV